MGEETQHLLDLIELVADGHGHIDWDALIRDAPDDSTRAALNQLRTVAGVAHVHATQVADPAATPQPSTRSPGGDESPAAAPPPLGRWGNFRLVRKVGEGAYGEVYEAIDTFLDHRVALKLLKPTVAKSRILHEAKLLVGLRHPSVIAVHGADTREGRTGFWMDFIEGRTLAEMVHAEKVRSADEAVVIGGHLCRALAAVHSVGIIHRDIKAQNVMRESGGRIVLMDFGAGEFVDPKREKGRPVGTPLYLAPELFDGGPASIQSDIYALGVLLFYLVTAAFPYVASSSEELREAHRQGKRRRLEDLRPDLPDAFVDVVDRMLAPDPAQRFESVTTARAALERVVVPDSAPTPGPVPRSSLRRWAVGTLLAMMAVTLLGLIATVSFNLTFGRTGAFAAEAPVQWLVWGARLMLAPVVYIAMAAAVLIFAVGGVRILCRLFSRAGATLTRASAAVVEFLEERQLNDPNLLLQPILGGGAIACIAITVAFWDQVSAFAIYINDAPANQLRALAPDKEHQFFLCARYLETLLLLYGTALVVVYRYARRALVRVHPLTTAAALVIPLLAVVVLRALPYRTVWQNRFERVDLGQERCYAIGKTSTQVLIYCPTMPPPRNQIVSADDPRLHSKGVVESVFAPFEASEAIGAANQ